METNFFYHVACCLFVGGCFLAAQQIGKQLARDEARRRVKKLWASQPSVNQEFQAVYGCYVGALNDCETINDVLEFKQAVMELELSYPSECYEQEFLALYDKANQKLEIFKKQQHA